MKIPNKIKVIVIASIVAMAMVMPAVMGAPDTETLRPNAVGDKSDWSATGECSLNYKCVDEETADEDDTYVKATTRNKIDLYHLQDISGDGTINNVTLWIRAKQTTGNEKIEPRIKTGGTEYKGTQFTPSTTSYADYPYTWDTNPDTGNAWTWDEINNSQAGQKSIGVGGWSGEERVTQVWIVVDYTPSDTTPPGNVTNVTVSTVSSSQLNVSWTKNEESDLVDHYNVYRNETSGFTPDNNSFVANTTPNYYLDSGLKANTTYYYRVTAVDTSEKEGNASEEAWNTTEAELPPTPFIITGYVFDKDGNDSNGPIVNVTNQAETWQAETNESYNYYELILDSKNVSADNTLEFNARDTAATQFNTTLHTVTQTELEDGGLFNFNLTLQEEEEEEVVNDTAYTEETAIGTIVTCNYTCTNESDGDYEVIEEKTTGRGKNKVSKLEHTWWINVTGGTNVTFYLEAHRTDSDDNDKFNFSYYKDGNTYYMLTVTNISDTNTSQTCELPPDLNGTVCINVTDTDRKVGNDTKDKIYIDHMFIRSVRVPDKTPPAKVTGANVTTVSSSQLNVSWTKNNESDLDHYNVYRNETTGFPPDNNSFVANTTTNYYLDSGLKASTIYYYRVTAVDDSGNKGNASEEAWNTTEAELPPTPFIITGYVFDKDGNDSNGPIVNVTNQAETWQAETNESYNYYELILDSENVSANDMLEFNARDTNATQFNTTQHAVTPDEINDGGLFNFNLTLHPPAGVNDTAIAEDTPKGTVIEGSYENTTASDNDYEVIEEVQSGQRSVLEHTWTINVTGGSKVTFHLEANRTDTGNEGDDFDFAYWNESIGDYVLMVTVNTSTDFNYSYDLPKDTSGNVSIQVVDTNNGNKKIALATIHVDYMYIRSEP